MKLLDRLAIAVVQWGQRVLDRQPLTVVGWASFKDLRPSAREDHAHVQAVIVELRRLRLREASAWHEHSAAGCPVLSDGTIFRSPKGWNTLVRIAWGNP